MPARGSIDRERLAGKAARRGGSGVERRVRPHRYLGIPNSSEGSPAHGSEPVLLLSGCSLKPLHERLGVAECREQNEHSSTFDPYKGGVWLWSVPNPLQPVVTNWPVERELSALMVVVRKAGTRSFVESWIL